MSRLLAEAQEIKAKLEAEETIVEFVEKVGPDGRTFGSITSKKIAEELQKQFGIKIDKRHIQANRTNWRFSSYSYYNMYIGVYTGKQKQRRSLTVLLN